MRRFERDLRGSNRELSRFGRGALVGSGALRGLGRAAAFASTSFIGGAGLIYGIKKVIDSAMETQRVLGQTENALEHAGLSWTQYGKRIEDAAQAQANLSGFGTDRLLSTFTTFVRKTGDVNRALYLNGLALNVARGRNIELEAATQLVLKATLGQAGALRRLGIEAPKGAKALQLIQLLYEKYAGSATKFADTAAGAQARFNVALSNTETTIGTALLPTITRLLDRGTAWLNNTKNQERIQRDVNKAVATGADVVKDLSDALYIAKKVLGPVVELVGGLRSAIELLLAAMVISKVTKFAEELRLIGPAAVTAGAGVKTAETEIAAAGGAAAVAATKVGRLTRTLGLLNGRVFKFFVVQQIIKNFIPGQGDLGLDFSNSVSAENAKGSRGSPYFRGTNLDLLYQAGLAGLGGAATALGNGATVDTAHLTPEERKAYQPGVAKAGIGAAAAGAAAAGPATAQAKRTVSPNIATSTALAKAQAEGSVSAIKAAAEARLKVIDTQIAFALKLEGKRGKTKQLEAALQGFYADEQSTQSIIDGINEDASRKAKTAAEKEKARAKKATQDAIKAALYGFGPLGVDVKALAKADAVRAKVAAKARALALDAKEGALSLARQAADLAVARAGSNEALLAKATELERKADRALIRFYADQEKHAKTVLDRQAAAQKKIAAQIDLAGLKKSKGASGYSLEELFAEAGSEFAMYGSNVGSGPLSAQDARGQFGGILKTHQTTVVQNFYGEPRPSQAMNDARSSARNLK